MSAWLENLTGLWLLDPWWLWLGMLLPLGVWFRSRHGEPTVLFAPAPFLRVGSLSGTPLPRSWRQRLWRLPRALQLLSLLLVLLALARPVQRVPQPDSREGIDILLCLDRSSSMAATDLDPDRPRLQVAKAAAAKFIAGRTDDRIGLLGFARFTDLVCPLTRDHGALRKLLDGLNAVEADGDEDLTGIGTAVARAAQVLRSSLARSKVVVPLTDGEENVATADTPDEIGPLRAGALCEELGVRVYGIAAGIGKQDRNGNWIELDTQQMRGLAERTGGAFFAARDADAVNAVYATIDQLERVAFEEPRFLLVDRFLPFLLVALSLWVVSRGLRASVLEVLP
jgi:Ca-activated chloride channel family protein